MPEIKPTTVAIAAAAAYFLFRPKDASAGTDSATLGTSLGNGASGGCGPGFVPGPDGFCVPEGESIPSGGGASKYAIQGFAGDGTDDPDMGPGGFAQLPGDPAQPLPPMPADVDMAQITSDDPRPAAFYQVKQGDYFNKIARESVYNAALIQLEMMAPFMPEAEKAGIATSVSNSGWKAYRDLIQCSPYNDMVYGTYGVGANAYKGLNGRGFRFLPKHADNFTRIDQGDEPLRNMQWGVPNGPKAQGVNAGPGFTSYELLWMPGISYPALIKPDFSFGAVELAQWPSWEWSQIVPPRAVWDRGFTDLAGDNDPNVYGCEGYEQAGG